MTDLLAVYVRNHLAAARGGVDLFRRAARNARGTTAGPALAALGTEVAADLESLLGIAGDLGIAENKPFGLAARLAERLGRLKPNGAVVRRSPLTALIETEALLDIVSAKSAGWRALLCAPDTRVGRVRERLEDLHGRAIDQRARLDALHDTAATRVFGAG